MTQEWFIDVLTDLRHVAEKKGMRATAAELKDLCLIAMAEIAEIGASDGRSLTADEYEPGMPDRAIAESDVA